MHFTTRFKLITTACLFATLAVGFALFGITGGATRAVGISSHRVLPRTTCGAWTVVPTRNPDPVPTNNGFSSVTALASNNVWAVGGTSKGTLIEHWNGSQWSVVASPSVGADGGHLSAVAAVSASDIWAVGSYFTGAPNQLDRTLIVHWNGSQWSVVPSTNPATFSDNLNGLTVVSAHNIWTVGSSQGQKTGEHTLVEHWNGTSWKTVSSPNPQPNEDYLTGVAALSASDIWAVGAAVTSGGITQTLVESWDGTRWSVVSSPNTTLAYNALSGVTATSADNIWAVGLYNNQLGRSARTLIEHWNGSQWSIVFSPNVPHTKNTLIGVTAISASDIWAVGDYATSVPGQTIQTLIEHWDGSQWSIVSSPSPGTKNILHSITVVPGTQQLWTVGGYPTIAEFYC